MQRESRRFMHEISMEKASFTIQYILLKTLEITCQAVKSVYFLLLLSMDAEILLIFSLAKYLGRYSTMFLREMKH